MTQTAFARPYPTWRDQDKYDAIVIGSGIGGLTAAALLAKHRKQKVLVLERHYTAGGFTHVFHRPGYEWDVGVHYIGRVDDRRHRLRRIFDDISDGQLRWQRMPDIYDQIHIGDCSYDFPSGVEKFRQQLKDYFPREIRAIDEYLAAVYGCLRWLGLYMAEKAIPAPLARWLGRLMRWPMLRWSDLTTAQVLQKITGNRELIAVLTGQWGDYGLPPSQSSFAIHAVVAHHYFRGASYPVGGAAQIAATIAPVIRAAGGQILINAEVSSILVQEGKAQGVRMADGRELRAPIIISDAGVANTFQRLLDRELVQSWGILPEFDRLQTSMAHLCLYLGLRGDPPSSSANLWIYPNADHDGNLARFMESTSSPWPLMFISFPSAKDPTFLERYPGRSTIELVAPAPYKVFQAWDDTRWKRRGEAYAELKAEFSERMLVELERCCPGTRAKIDYAELSTPLSTQHFAGYQHGEIYGTNPTPQRFRARFLQPRTPLPGLFLTGADACIAGVTGAMMGGVLAASAIDGRNLLAALGPKAR